MRLCIMEIQNPIHDKTVTIRGQHRREQEYRRTESDRSEMAPSDNIQKKKMKKNQNHRQEVTLILLKLIVTYKFDNIF